MLGKFEIKLNMAQPQTKLTYPGELIKNELKEREISQREFAEAVGVSQSYLNDILKGRRRISLPFAKKTEDLLGISQQTLLNMQTANDIVCKEGDCADALELEAKHSLEHLNQVVSVKALLKVLSRKYKTYREKLQAIVDFFELSNDAQNEVQKMTAGCFRKSETTGLDEQMIKTWVVIANAATRSFRPQGRCDKSQMNHLCAEVSRILHENKRNTLVELRELLSEYGIGLLLVDKVERASIDGYSFFKDGIPYIALTCRYDRIDNLAFNVLHELGHIALGHTTEVSPQLNIDVRSFDDEQEDDMENEANVFAANMLIPEGIWKFAPTMPWNPFNIQKKYTQWANSKNLNPWIVLGRLSHETGMYKFRSDESRKIKGGKEGLCREIIA